MTSRLRRGGTGQAVAAGVSAAVLGDASSVAVVVAGLTAVGASPGQVGSGLLALGLVMGVTSIALSAGLQVPVSVVWTTPGLALLPAVGALEGGFPAAVGAFVVVGLLVLLTGLLPFCLAPARGVAELRLEAVALPVDLVTMAAQNLVGIAVLTSQGYRAPVGPVLVTTGSASALAAPFGAPTTNLTAITGALTAGPAAHEASADAGWRRPPRG